MIKKALLVNTNYKVIANVKTAVGGSHQPQARCVITCYHTNNTK